MNQNQPNAIDAAKQMLFEQFQIQYTSICNMVKKLPIHPKMADIILLEFDTGYLWLKEAFIAMHLENTPVPPANVPDENKIENPPAINNEAPDA